MEKVRMGHTRLSARFETSGREIAHLGAKRRSRRMTETGSVPSDTFSEAFANSCRRVSMARNEGTIFLMRASSPAFAN